MQMLSTPVEPMQDADDELQSLLHEARQRVISIRQLETEARRRLQDLRAQGPSLPPPRPPFRWRNVAKRLLGVRLLSLHHYPHRKLKLPRAYFCTPLPKNAPLISIVTPSYNQAAFIERTMTSVLSQGYPRLEYIVQDGGSQDGTGELLARYDSRLTHWESIADRGQAHAINLGFRHATGEIMAWLNSDDVLLPGALAYVGEYFARNPMVDVVYGHRILIDREDGDIGRMVLPPHDNDVMPWADFIPQETMFWRRRIWERVGGALDESFQFAMDWDLLLRFRAARAKFARLPRFLGGFRMHEEQKTQTHSSTVGERDMARLRREHLGRDVTRPEIYRAIMPYLLRHVWRHRLYQLGILRY